ncbi:DUF221-domain-containing protein [Acrodontium crateriforme]|uniref:DUF221-domain-containing protein n=1 Tax=Acrodontium crateriforme TaxID=150365 RepID=A0AAQ3RDQ3_9PEZI|nr:DUF221-domain-containing protein [Acrodontium crateriforme]
MDAIRIFLAAAAEDDDDDFDRYNGSSNPRDTTIQLMICVTFGLAAFLSFCALRPRWTSLYAARKRQKNAASPLPELPDTFFGWIKPLWKITDQQVLASGGLDAYVFLAFFKLAMKFLAITLFFSLIVIKPVHDANPDDAPEHNKTSHGLRNQHTPIHLFATKNSSRNPWEDWVPQDFERDYLWMYVVFAYLFSGIAIYLITTETRRIIEVRQEYLGSQTTVTDRTIRLSGIPVHLQDEEKIKEFIESLDIGRVESVTLCRHWKELDQAIIARMETIRRLEEAHTIYQKNKMREARTASLPLVQGTQPAPLAETASDDAQGEDTPLNGTAILPPVTPYISIRPRTRIRESWFTLRGKQVDAIDYFQSKLDKADERIKQLRKSTFAPTPLAFITMDSVAACQMAIQAVLDPSPQQLIANQSPAPSDVIWQNTYLSRRSRVLRSWAVTGTIVLLTIFWSAIQVPIAGLLTTKSISAVLPQFGKFLEEHENIKSLVNTQLPTAIASLLTVIVPYLYYFLSWRQGMISQGDIELSTISKNFFFTFFNFFVVFTILGTASKFYQFFEKFGDALRNFQGTAYALALALARLLPFYVNFIILQGIGLFPFRLLEVGSVSLYPVYRMGAKTPRDYAELVQPPIFSYGFYLPTALLIFIICMVYSVLRSSWTVLLAGFAYFFLGHFVYKYQLLYAMDHQQHSTGRAWTMICDRIFIGLIFFQATTAGQLLLKKQIPRSGLIVPLLLITIWTQIMYGRTYKPLMKFIALRSVKRAEPYSDDPLLDIRSMTSSDLAPERNVWAEIENVHMRYHTETRTRYNQPGHDSPIQGLQFVNPSLVAPLNGVWIADKGLEPVDEPAVIEEAVEAEAEADGEISV